MCWFPLSAQIYPAGVGYGYKKNKAKRKKVGNVGTRDTYFNGYGLTYNEVKKIEDKCKNAKGRELELLLLAAESAYAELAQYLFFSLTSGLGYDNISKICNIPIGRKDFYGYRRKTIYLYNRYMMLEGHVIV